MARKEKKAKKQAEKLEAKLKKREERLKEEGGPQERVEFEELPRKLQKKILKRKQKREALRSQRKNKIDWELPEEKIYERYR